MSKKEIATAIDGHRARNRELRIIFEERKVDLDEPRPIEFHFWTWTQRDAAVLGRSLYQIISDGLFDPTIGSHAGGR